jgi:hypothetical protein
MDLCGELNRLAGFTYADRSGIARAAALWAGAPVGTELVGALNYKAGYVINGNCLELNGILQRLGLADRDQGGFTVALAEGGVQQLNNTLRLPGLSGNYMSTPDAGAISITGDIDIRVKVALDQWVGGASFISKWVAPNRSWTFIQSATNKRPQFAVSADGSAVVVNQTASADVPFGSGEVGWYRVTFDVDNGSAGNDVKFYTSTDGITWVQLGITKTTAGVASVFDGTQAILVGSQSGTDVLSAQNIYYAEVRSGIDGPVVAKFDSTTVAVRGERLPTTHTQASRAEAVRLPGVAGNYISQPDSAANSVTGDIDVRVKCAADDWTPAAQKCFVSKWNGSTQKSFFFLLQVDGTLRLYRSTDGAAESNHTSTANVTSLVSDGGTLWVRVTYATASGEIKFYTSADGATWAQLGATVAGTAGAIFDSTSALEIGTLNAGVTFPWAGTIYEAQVRNGIDGPAVASFNAAAVQPTGAKTPATVDLWTINGAAWSWDVPVAEPSSGALRLPGVAGNYVSTPDAADISIVGDIDLRCKVQMDDWTPAGSQTFIAKRDPVGGAESFHFRITSAGLLNLLWTADGITFINIASTVATGVTDGATKWVRATLDVDNGLVGNDVKFYLSDDGITYTQLGATVTTALVTSIFDSARALTIGARASTGDETLAGYIYKAEVYSGIAGTLVASFDAQSAPITTNRLPATVVQSGRTWTLNGSLWQWVNQPAPTAWTVNGSAWWWGLSSSSRYNNVLELDPQYVTFPGTSGNYASTPDSAGLSITGDIDLRIKCAADDWTPASAQDLIAKFTSVGNLRSYMLQLRTDGKLMFYWSADGTVSLSAVSSVATGFTDGSVHWVRATFDVDNGSSGRDIKFYTSDDGVTWTQLGSTQTGAGVTSIADTTSVVTVGDKGDAVEPFAGKVYYAEIRNGIGGTIVGEFNPGVSAMSAIRTPTSFSSGGATWTMNGSAWSYSPTAWPSISAPDSAALSITGDIDLRVRVSGTVLDGAAGSKVFIGKSGSGQRAYVFRMNSVIASTGGQLQLLWRDSGGTTRTVPSTAVLPTTYTGWLRVTLDVDDGAGDHAVNFYTSTDGVTWTQNGTANQHYGAATTSIIDSTALVYIGADGETPSRAPQGTIHYAEVRNGIAGTVVGVWNPNVMHLTGLDPATNTATTPTTMASPTGETWTVSGSGWRWRVTG